MRSTRHTASTWLSLTKRTRRKDDEGVAEHQRRLIDVRLQTNTAVSLVDKSKRSCPSKLRGDRLLVEGNKTVCLVGQCGWQRVTLGVLVHGDPPTAAYQGNKEEG